MNFLNQHILSFLLFSPFVGIVLLLLIPNGQERLMHRVAFLASLIPFALSLFLWSCFPETGPLNQGSLESPFSLNEVVPWIPSMGIFYRIGVDGVSLLLVLLTTFLMPIVFVASWTSIGRRVREYYLAFLFLEVGLIGVFIAVDLFLFYLFWELVLIPMYLIIGIWGGERRIYAAIKFVLYTMVGSLLMLAAVIYLYFAAGHSFNFVDLMKISLPVVAQKWLFGAFVLAFAIKVPLFPFHTWLPDAHVEAPTGGSVILAGLLLKMGTYGLFRLGFPLFPEAMAALTPLLITLSVIGILYGALVAMVQTDIKKLVAFSSVSHMGFVVLGLAATSTIASSGAVLQMINHGLSTGALFLLVGMLYERRHTRRIADFGGLAKIMPVYTTLFLIVALSSIGLPGTNGFIGEFLILIGSFKNHPVATGLSTLGVIFAAVYLLWMVQRVFLGPVTHEENNGLSDLSKREIGLLLPIIILIFAIGFYPAPLLKKIEPAVKRWMEMKQGVVHPRVVQ
ncbi:MAG: NADH-quinone oxidoreductase subunit M [Deltaproteobacteria bacterium]|nr:NADH-quinone oxidoreductase subunit M [Deltaproteobacteria bacterium]